MNEINTVNKTKYGNIKLTWLPSLGTENHDALPVKQVSGIVFDELGKLLISRSTPTKNWGIAGGKPESSETLVDTLKRELLEEVNVKIKDTKLLGYIKVVENFDTNPSELYYQAKMFGIVDKVLDSKVDPASGNTYQRVFIPYKDLSMYISWGDVDRKSVV